MRRLGVHPHASHDWHAARRLSVGASEVAALLGLGNPAWHSPGRVWAAKVSLEPAPLSARGELLTSFGTVLEPLILGATERAIPSTIYDGASLGQLAHDDAPHLTCHLDGWIAGDGAQVIPVEAKWTQSSDAPQQWSDLATWLAGPREEWPLDLAGTSLEAYYIQVQSQMAITDAPHAYLAGLLGYEAAVSILAGLPLPDDSLRVLLVPRDAALCDRIPREIEAFWRTHVETRTPPTVTPSDLEALHAAKRAEGEVDLGYSTDVRLALEDLAVAQAELLILRKPYEARIDAAKALLEAQLLAAGARRATCNGWCIARSYIATKPRPASGYWKTSYKAPRGD